MSGESIASFRPGHGPSTPTASSAAIFTNGNAMSAYTKAEFLHAARFAERTSAHTSTSDLAAVCLFSCLGLIITGLFYLFGFGAELTWALAAG